MKSIKLLLLATVMLSSPVLPTNPDSPRESVLESEINESFKSMYLHIGYVSNYMSKRAKEISEQRLVNAREVRTLRSVAEKNCKLLGFKNSDDIPYLKTSLNLDKGYLTNLEETNNDNMVLSLVRSGLKNLETIVEIWKNEFESQTEIIDWERGLEKNLNLYTLMLNDYLYIFYKAAKTIYDLYGIKEGSVRPEEIYAKGIFIEGMKTKSSRGGVENSRDQAPFIQLTKNTFIPNTHLLKRMFYEMEKQIDPCPKKIKVLIKIFWDYKKCMELM